MKKISSLEELAYKMFLSWSYGVKGRKTKVRLRVGLEWSGLDSYRHSLPGMPHTRTNSSDGGWTQHLCLLIVYPQVPTFLSFFLSFSHFLLFYCPLFIFSTGFYVVQGCGSERHVLPNQPTSSFPLTCPPGLPHWPAGCKLLFTSHLWSHPSPFCVLEPESWLPWNWN